MLIETKWFGTVDIEDDKVITFEKGIIGFEELKKYTIIYDSEDSDEKTIMWLQSVEEKSLALPVLHPEIIMSNYDPIVDDELLALLGEIKNAELIVLVTLTVPTDITKMTSNLKAPVIINTENLKGCQIIANNDNYQVKYPIYELLQGNTGKDGE